MKSNLDPHHCPAAVLRAAYEDPAPSGSFQKIWGPRVDERLVAGLSLQDGTPICRNGHGEIRQQGRMPCRCCRITPQGSKSQGRKPSEPTPPLAVPTTGACTDAQSHMCTVFNKCMWICTCTHTYEHTYEHTYVHTFIHSYIHTCIPYMHKYIYIHTCTLFEDIHVSVYTYTYRYIYICTCKFLVNEIEICGCVNLFTHTYILTSLKFGYPQDCVKADFCQDASLKA